jgi:hypothetical protein
MVSQEFVSLWRCANNSPADAVDTFPRVTADAYFGTCVLDDRHVSVFPQRSSAAAK